MPAAFEPDSLFAPTVASLLLVLVLAVRAALAPRPEGPGRQPPNAQQLGPYRLLGPIGAGGMGVVYRARHVLLGRSVALKLFGSAASTAGRCDDEARLLSRLNHPNVVALHDYGYADGRPYCAMELLDGVDLEQLIEREGAQDPRRVVHVLLQAAGALGAVHAAGLVHGDVKPANLFLCRDRGAADAVKLLDFGLARGFGPGVEAAGAKIAGTPRNMAPECFSAPDQVGPAADLYSLGTVAYALLTGSPMFGARSVGELAAQHLYALPAPLGCRAPFPISAELEGALMRCLRKSPEERPSAAELRRLLAACPEANGWSAERAAAAWCSGSGAGEPPGGDADATEPAVLAPSSSQALSWRRCG